VRAAVVARFLLLASVAGCGSADVSEPLVAARTLPTQDPARGLAIGRGPGGGTAIAMVLELRDVVRLFEETGGDVQSWGDVAVGVGPRSIAAVGEDFVTADTTGGTLSRITVAVDSGSLSAVTTGPIDPPPFHVAPVGPSTFAVVLGTGDAAAVQLWQLPTGAPPAPPTPLAAPLPLADATLAVSTPRGLLVVRRLAGDVVTLVANAAGELSVAAITPVCDEPRAAAPLADGEVAIACAAGVVFLDVTRAALPYQGNLYDLVAVDLDLDGMDDLAAVDLATHAALVWYGDTAAPHSYPLSRGPIALRPADLGADGDQDLIVLAFEARALDLLENVLKGESP
jgi:hypothetical protein